MSRLAGFQSRIRRRPASSRASIPADRRHRIGRRQPGREKGLGTVRLDDGSFLPGKRCVRVRIDRQHLAVPARRAADVVGQRLGEKPFAVVGNDDAVGLREWRGRAPAWHRLSCSAERGAGRSRSTRTTCWLRAMIRVFTVVEWRRPAAPRRYRSPLPGAVQAAGSRKRRRR